MVNKRVRKVERSDMTDFHINPVKRSLHGRNDRVFNLIFFTIEFAQNVQRRINVNAISADQFTRCKKKKRNANYFIWMVPTYRFIDVNSNGLDINCFSYSTRLVIFYLR